MRQSWNISTKALVGVGVVGAIVGFTIILSRSRIFGDEGEPVADPSEPIVEQIPAPEREIKLDPVDIPLPGDPPNLLGGSVWLDYSLVYHPDHETTNMFWKANESFYLVIGDLADNEFATVEFPVDATKEGIVEYKRVHFIPEDPCFGAIVIKYKVQYHIKGEFVGYPGCTLELNVTSKLLDVVEFTNSCPVDWRGQASSIFFPVNEVLEFDPYNKGSQIKGEIYTFGLRGLTPPENSGCGPLN